MHTYYITKLLRTFESKGHKWSQMVSNSSKHIGIATIQNLFCVTSRRSKFFTCNFGFLCRQHSTITQKQEGNERDSKINST